MKKIIAIFIFPVFISQLQAQEIKRTVVTDSSVIKTSIYGYTNNTTKQFVCTAKTIEESYKGKDLVHITGTFKDTTVIAHDYYIEQHSNKRIGLSRSYSKEGQLRLTVDNDSGTWTPADTSEYPNYAVLNKMKLKGDSIIHFFYGDYFCRKYIRWNIYSSYYFDSAYLAEPSFALEWLRSDTKNKYTSATEFYISYNIYNEDNVFENAIRIIINSNGKLLPAFKWNEYWTIHNQGLENVNTQQPADFQLLKKNEAIALAKQQGLKIKDPAKINCSLEWQATKENAEEIQNGRFVFSVKQLIPVTKKEHQHKGEIHYIKWLFDPWTKAFIEKKEVFEKNIFAQIF